MNSLHLFIRFLLFSILTLPSLAVTVTERTTAQSFDVVVYGGTSAGVIAAVQAARMGKSVALLEPGKHIGGMSAEGLGGSDIDNHGGFQNSPAVGGPALEFYRRVSRHYGRLEQFEAMLQQRAKQPALWRFEPHVAEAVFNEMVKEHGLIPTIQDDPLGTPGAGDHRIQAYCFRMCLTKNPANLIPFAKPAGYDPAQYEIYRRYAKAGGKLWKPGASVPNGKSDQGSWHDLSANLYGMNYNYPGGDHATRRRVYREHLMFTQGLC